MAEHKRRIRIGHLDTVGGVVAELGKVGVPSRPCSAGTQSSGWPRAWMRPSGRCDGDDAEPPLRGPWKGYGARVVSQPPAFLNTVRCQGVPPLRQHDHQEVEW